MKISFLVALVATTFATPALAQDAEPEPTPPPPMVVPSPSASAARDAPPPANTGFQLALRTGYMLPLGSATGAAGDDLSKSFSGQVPFILDIGAKVTPHIFLGVYGGVGLGGAGSGVSPMCDADGLSCTTLSLRAGVQAQYHFAPDATVNPWIGYGIGYESTSFNASAPSGGSFSLTAAGPEFAHFSAGLDFRLSETIGLGPVLDFSVGQYSSVSTSTNGVSASGDVTNTALHQWFMIGARVVFFP